MCRFRVLGLHRYKQKTLFSAMESVISMMREVEVQEKAVDIVQEEASRGGLDIMVKVEELKQMLAHAKDANDMHAGEVFGEKAILATEARELQSRLLNLSDGRDKSLAILNESIKDYAAAEKNMKGDTQISYRVGDLVFWADMGWSGLILQRTQPKAVKKSTAYPLFHNDLSFLLVMLADPGFKSTVVIDSVLFSNVLLVDAAAISGSGCGQKHFSNETV